jgi:hypothetical protein
LSSVFQALVDSMARTEPMKVRTEHEQELYEKDLKIAQLESRVRDLERRISDYGWAESARHSALSGGTL